MALNQRVLGSSPSASTTSSNLKPISTRDCARRSSLLGDGNQVERWLQVVADRHLALIERKITLRPASAATFESMYQVQQTDAQCPGIDCQGEWAGDPFELAAAIQLGLA